MNKNLFVLQLFILFCFYQGLSQEVSPKAFQLAPYIGINLPQGELKDFSKNGAVFGISIDKYLSENFALGIDFNYQSNDFSNPFDFSNISAPYSILNATNGKWNTSTITVGPTYRWGSSKFNAEIFAKLGLLYLKTPQAASVLQYPDGTKTIFDLPVQERSGFGVTSGIRLNYQISKNLSLFLNPQYVYGSAKIEYCNCGLDNLNNPELIIDQDPIKETFSPSYFNVNAGLTFSLGGEGNDSSKNINEAEGGQDDVCGETFLHSPYDKESFNLNIKKVLIFRWKNQTPQNVKNYILRISDDNNNLIYEKEIKTNSFDSDKKLINLLKESSKDKIYSWNITTNFKNCESTVTENSTFSAGSRAGTIHDITLSCDSPAYTDTGNLLLTGELVFFNSSYSNMLTVDLNDISINDTSDIPISGAVISNLRYCSTGNPVIFPISIPASNTPSPTICFDLELPSGTTNIISRISGIVDGTNQSSGDPDSVPNCVCNICEDWEFNDTEHTLNKFNIQGFPFNFQMAQSLQIIGAAPIMEVKAEIIRVRHVANDPQCYTCTKHEDKMGLFSFAPNFLQPRISGTSAQNDWTNGADAIKGTDTNNDNYSNQAIWRAKDPSVGVDFNLMKRFILPISLPDPSSLDCCEHTYEVCVRYTFTDINCASCSYDRCYLYDGTTEPIGNGNPHGGIGNTETNTPNVKLNNN